MANNGVQQSQQLDVRPLLERGVLAPQYVLVPLKKVPLRVAKYEVVLREAPLRATQALHAILTRMVVFTCNQCSERFPTFHPAYAPPPEIAKDMEILRRGKDGVAACNVEVATWDELPPLDAADGIALCCTGCCLRCAQDAKEQMLKLCVERNEVVLRRSAENHMGPCFRFPWHDLESLFAEATLVEAMLVALDHMQVNFVRVSSTGMRKFRRSTLSFPQDLPRFAERLQLMKGFRVKDRVNSARGFGVDPLNPDRAVRPVTGATDEEREKYAVDASGCLVFPAKVLEVQPKGLLVLEYDGGGVGYEWAHDVVPRFVLPWHPRNVPFHLMLRRNVGRGRRPVEGLQARWHHVSNLLQALCAYPRNEYGPWRLGGTELEPMHKFYDPKLFDVMTESEMKCEYAPKERDSVLLKPSEVAALSRVEKEELSVDVTTVEHFMASGFDVNFIGPEDVGDGAAGARSEEASPGGPGVVDPVVACSKQGIADTGYVSEEAFCVWLDRSEFVYGMQVQRWWTGLFAGAEDDEDALKQGDDETNVELFRRIRSALKQEEEEQGAVRSGAVAVRDDAVNVSRLVAWLQKEIPDGFGSSGDQAASSELVVDDVYHELVLAEWQTGGGLEERRGAIREELEKPDEEDDAVRIAERLVYGWPNKNDAPTGACDLGRFVRAFPLEFPMGIADLFEVRPRKVTCQEWVQHLIRYRTGQFVGGERGQRVLWAMVNTLLLTEARQRGWGIYRNVMRRTGLGLQGGRVLTKRDLRGILQQEDRARVLVSQLSTVGRDVRSTTMQWAYEGKKLDCTVKHMSWVPPWVDQEGADCGDRDIPLGRRFMDLEIEHGGQRFTKEAGEVGDVEKEQAKQVEKQKKAKRNAKKKDTGVEKKENAAEDVLVPDAAGLGRHPCLWWTMNCKYNAAYDVQRLNTRSAAGTRGLRSRGDGGSKEERFEFTRENPDLVSYQLALRTELLMRMVMPAIVPHSSLWPYMTMARFETGSGGNPHWHGFSMGVPGPVVKRVKADVEGGDDLPPQTTSDDLRLVRRSMLAGKGDFPWAFDDVWTAEQVRQRMSAVLRAGDRVGADDGVGAGEASGEEGSTASPGGEGVAAEETAVNADLLEGRVAAVLSLLLTRGEVEELPGEGEGERSDLRYRLVPPVPEVTVVVERPRRSSRVGGRPVGVRSGDVARRLEGNLEDLGCLKLEEEGQQLQSQLEEQFAEFFNGIVSEWNPCFTDGGRWRYKWDDEVGAHDVEVDADAMSEGNGVAGKLVHNWAELDALDEGYLSESGRAEWDRVQRGWTAERKAMHDVSAREPDRVNLRGLLDKVFAAPSDAASATDVQRVRRLVAALVNRVARHTKHGHQAPTLGVHACARGKEGCPVCRYGFPKDPFPRGEKRRMAMEKGSLEGQWHARFPRNDRLCCNYEAHVLLANMGNIDWRPVLNLCAVVQYVTKYATKAPKGSRRLQEVLKDAVDEVCEYVPEGEGQDFLRRAIQKFFARSLGDRDYHAYEGVQLGMQLPLVIPMMPIFSLNTSGAKPLKSWFDTRGADKEDEPVHYDSRVDKFNKRLQLVQRQIDVCKDRSITVEEIKNVSLYEFWWKYVVYKGRVRRSARPVCLMVTPCFSADCANVEHANHDGYARSMVIAYWRHMPTAERHGRIEKVFESSGHFKAEDRVCWGATPFETPRCGEHRYLGTRDLYMKFEGAAGGDGWKLALMEMLTDPMLLQWVPEWVREQYTRANPFFREVLTALVRRGRKNVKSNVTLLKYTKKEMIRRHRRQLARDAMKKQREKERGKEGHVSTTDDECSVSGSADSDEDEDRVADKLVDKLADAAVDSAKGEPVEIIREPRPEAGGDGGAASASDEWARRSAAELVSAAGRAPQARDRSADAGELPDGLLCGESDALGVLFNPKGFDWTQQSCNVHHSEEARIKGLQEKWYGKALVGDGADEVMREELDPWQKFAHDIVMDDRHVKTQPLRLMLLGSAGTGKSRTLRSFVGARRKRCRESWAGVMQRARLRGERAGQMAAERVRRGAGSRKKPVNVARGVAECLGVAREEAEAAVEAFERSRVGRERQAEEDAAAEAERRVVEIVSAEVERRVKNVCLLAAPTGCASFQLKFGACTLHRAFGVPVGYCGPWKDRTHKRFRKMKLRLEQAQLFVLDEVSMIGRQMLGRIEFKLRNTLAQEVSALPAEMSVGGRRVLTTLVGRDTVLSGDLRQANPLGDDPFYTMGAYTGKGQNKPKGADRTPDNAWTMARLAVNGQAVRDSFEDVCVLRQVHRYVEERSDLSPECQEQFKQDAIRFLKVTRAMADCDPENFTKLDHAWLSRRNRSFLQQTPEGREELRKFDGVASGKPAPLLMDGRKDDSQGKAGANRLNQMKLLQLSAEKRVPILPIRAYHDKPKNFTDKCDKMDADDFRGIENEVLLAVGARILLTQNLWVEVGLMNGALGHVVGYMWPEGGDPHSVHPKKRSPLCVFVEFDDVRVGEGQLSFFPGDPVRHKWVPIFRQCVGSSVEEKVSRENYPLQLAWAMTHWKAQGMTLDRSRVHLTERSVGIPGLAFVACTRVRHPSDLVFEEDLPDYEHFMKARRTPAFRARKRYELRCEVRASRTLRRYGYCEADLWTDAERQGAEALISGLKITAKEQLDRLSVGDKRVDASTWLWGHGAPDFDGELRKQVERLAAGDEVQRAMLGKVADRLLDRHRVRVATPAESALAEKLLEGMSGIGEEDRRSEAEWRGVLLERAKAVAAGGVCELETVEAVARKVAGCLVRRGFWSHEVEDAVTPQIQPLHMSAVRDALGALIPAGLHESLDKAVQKGKDDFGPLRGGSVLRMDGWKVNVRTEDALARGQLQEDALEFFVKILQHAVKVLALPLAVGSKTVGKHVGVQESPETLHCELQSWKAVWNREDVRKRRVLVLPVAVDDRKVQKDWICVVVRSSVSGELLGEAGKLRFEVHDFMQRQAVARRVAQNIDVLIRGLHGRLASANAEIVFVQTPECRVASQRILYAFGRVLGCVSAAASVEPLNPSSEAFVPDTGLAARAVFAYLREKMNEHGVLDVANVLCDAAACREVLRRFNTVPSLRSGGLAVGQGRASGDPRGDGVPTMQTPGLELARLAAGLYGGSDPSSSKDEGRSTDVCPLRVASWNIAGGHVSAQAPSKFSAEDQRASLFREVFRWRDAYGCDVLALQEGEQVDAYSELMTHYDLAGAVEAKANRGYVHVYVRRCEELKYERLELGSDSPCVAVRVFVKKGDMSERACVVVAVHLPHGDAVARRKAVLQGVLGKLQEEKHGAILIGDMNMNKEDEASSVCEDLRLKDARYNGFSWGVQGNKFYVDSKYTGSGMRKDRVLFGQRVWVAAHLVGQCEQYFDGERFYLSDHFGLMAYVDVDDAYGSRAKLDVDRAKARRRELVGAMERNQQKEIADARERRQAGREEQALLRRRAQERDRDDLQRAQRRGAKQRRDRQRSLWQSAFGPDSLFSAGMQVLCESQSGEPPVSPTQVCIPSGSVPLEGFGLAESVPLRGLVRRGNTCYVLAVAQVLLRTPGMHEWIRKHREKDRCDRATTTCVLCSLGKTLQSVACPARLGRDRAQPALVLERRRVDARFDSGAQQCAFEFTEALLNKLRVGEVSAMRCGPWPDVSLPDMPVATHVDRLFGFVREERLRCRRCRRVRCKYERDFILRLRPREVHGGPLSVEEMYYDFCSAQELTGDDAVACAGCDWQRTDHDRQDRIVSAPNVLVVQVKRNPEGVEAREHSDGSGLVSRNVVGAGGLIRVPVHVEDRLSLPGGIDMNLVGVIFHNGETLRSGHYTCLCRGPGGGFWYYNDDYPVQKRYDEVAHIKPREVYMIVYAKRRQEWRDEAPEIAPVVDLGGGALVPEAGQTPRRGEKRDRLDSASVGVGASADELDRGGAACTPSRRLRRKSSLGSSPGRAQAVSASAACTPLRRLSQKTSACSSPGGVAATSSEAAVPVRTVSDTHVVRESTPAASSSLPPSHVVASGGGAETGSGRSSTVGESTLRMGGGGGGRIVSGFGFGRVEDVAADERRRIAEGAQRGRQRSDAGVRGRMTTFSGEDLDRSAGSAWHAGRR